MKRHHLFTVLSWMFPVLFFGSLVTVTGPTAMLGILGLIALFISYKSTRNTYALWGMAAILITFATLIALYLQG